MLVFRNRGLVDLRALTIIGVNSKDTKSPIGQFGTGFKYAVAVALRLGATIVVYRGTERFEFTARHETIRNDEFSIVYMNDQQLGFTTHLGHHWQPWQVFRELYCNMLDEQDGEAFLNAYPPVAPEEGYTTICLDGRDFDAVWAERNTIVLPPKVKKLYADSSVEIIDAPSPFVYYRGVRVGEWKEPALYTYNVLDKLKLTEDRTLENLWSIESTIRSAIRRMTDKTLLRSLLVVDTPVMEAGLDLSYGEFTPEFYEVVHRARANKSLNKLALISYRVKNPEVTMPARVEGVTKQEKKDLKEALALCAVIGYNIENSIVITDELPDNVMGQVFPKHSDKIFIARRTFSMGLLSVAGTLLEEFIHLKYGLADNTRELQNHLLDTLMRSAQRILFEKRGGVVPLAAPVPKE